ncbi:MAG: SIMPL domain-containing protein, partial [Pseudorhodobacter sp.]|nr:SIMPL domain-containing protein [Pseudorhodobacter sp.]
ALAAVLARLQAAGIEAKDYQTSSLSLNPNWVNNPAGTGSEINGYIATNLLTVKVRAVDQVGTVLDAVITDGANTLNSLTFGLQNPRPVEDEARKQAVADAMARATLIATAAGAKLGAIQSITEGGNTDMPIPMYKMTADAAVPVAAGEVETSASVTIVFQLGQ